MDYQNVNRITISSSDGWDSIEIILVKLVSESDIDSGLLTTIRAKGQFWERDKSLKTDEVKLADDFDILLPQVILSKKGLKSLRNQLETWLIEQTEIDVEVSLPNLARLNIFVGETDDFICSKSKPVFSLSYVDSRIELNLKFVTDQSCLNLMLEGLRSCLRAT
jgi:hypothetical protein